MEASQRDTYMHAFPVTQAAQTLCTTRRAQLVWETWGYGGPSYEGARMHKALEGPILLRLPSRKRLTLFHVAHYCWSWVAGPFPPQGGGC